VLIGGRAVGAPNPGIFTVNGSAGHLIAATPASPLQACRAGMSCPQGMLGYPRSEFLCINIDTAKANVVSHIKVRKRITCSFVHTL